MFRVSAQDLWLKELKQRAADGRVALICGTGVAAAISSGAPHTTWSALLRNGIEYLASIDTRNQEEAHAFLGMLDRSTSAAALVSVAEWVKAKFGEYESGEFRSWLANTVGALEVQSRDLLHVLNASIPVFTTNYDSLIEELTGRSSVCWDERGALSRFNESSADYVFHLHGHYLRPESIILSGGDYGKLEAVRGATQALEAMAAFKTLVFVGAGNGLDDPNLNAFITWFEEAYEASPNRLYVLTRTQDLPPALVKGKRAHLGYGADYADLPAFLSEILGTPAPRVTLPATEEGARGRDDHQSPAVLPLRDEKHLTDGTTQDTDPLDGTTGTRAKDTWPTAITDLVEETLGRADDRSEFQAEALLRSEAIVEDGSAALLSAVTGTGKTTVARVAMNFSIAENASSIMILPTKALVAQEVREWRTWEHAWDVAGRKIRVYGSSRDYPENDSPVSKGRFEIVIAIYEKLAAYLVSGRRTLSRTSLIVIDELQTLVEDKQRAKRLEALLTMIRLLPPEHRPAILGLSATMSKQSTGLLRDWIGIPDTHFIQTNRRPIPLDTYVVDAARWRIQPDAHLWNLREDGIEPPRYSESRHELEPALSKHKVHNLSTGDVAVSLVARLLEEDPNRRILVFVPGRTAAQDLARQVQAAVQAAIGPCSRRGNPWTSGRFANQSLDAETADERYTALSNSDLPMQDDVVRGLRTGIVFHTARLAPKFRRDLEEEFVDPNGVLRVLIATDTLAVGVNLPADVVIATSISGFAGNGQRHLLTPAELDNKAGRAGRRGMTSRARGEFYILVPNTRDLQGVVGVGVSEAQTLSTIGGVYDRYVRGVERSPAVRGQIRDLDDIALLTLQVLCADGFGRKFRSLQGRVDAVIAALLMAQEPNPQLPSSDTVIDRLFELRLLTKREDAKVSPSRLGETLARSALSLGSADILEIVSRLAVNRAGDIDLLFNAARSAEMSEVTAWVSLPAVDSRHYPSLKENIITYAMAYCHPNLQRRIDCAQYCAQGRYDLPERLVLEGQHVTSNILLEMFETDVEAVDNADATALLRALVAFEWSRGVPFGDIKARFSAAIHSDEVKPRERPVELRLHYSDVEQLCEQIAGIIRGASEISITASQDWSARMRLLALQVEAGLPAWLAPIAKMRIGALHRSRLSLLWEQEPIDDNWSAILELPPLASHRGITEEQRTKARERLENRAREEAENRHKIAAEWADGLIPGGEGVSFEELGDDLTGARDANRYCELLADLGKGLGLEVTVGMSGSFGLLTWSSGPASCSIYVPTAELGADEVQEAGGHEGIVMLRTQIRPSGFAQLASGPSVAKFLQPEVVLSVIARLCLSRGDAVQPGEVVERLRDLKVSVLDSDAVSFHGEQTPGPPPFEGSLPSVRPTQIFGRILEDDVE